jgi:hypothetical protein
MRLTKFSKDEHIATGTELLAMDKQVLALASKVAGAYGRTSYEAKQVIKIRKALLELRSGLENRYCSEHPADHIATHVYFGTPESRQMAGVVAKITSKE